MRERIILAPGANGTELIKSLAAHGVNSFNLRVCGAGELARMALMRCGIPVEEDFVSSREETAIIAEAVKGVSYFDRAVYSDIREIAGAVRRMRSLVPEEDEKGRLEEILGQGPFQEKNAALLTVYKNYMALLSGRKRVDAVALVRRAVKDCAVMDADFHTLEEYPPNPLEKRLLEKLSGGKAHETSLPELFGIRDPSYRFQRFYNCYGAPNEVETILADIYASKKLDRCTVAVTDTVTYGQLFFDYALLYDLPVTFGCGIPILNSNPARLLVLYDHWMTDGFFGAQALRTMLSSGAFDRSKLAALYPETDADFHWRTYGEVAGAVRLTNDAAVNAKRLADYRKALAEEEGRLNPADERGFRDFVRRKKCVPLLEVLSRELSLPAEDFIVKYSLIRRGEDSNAGRLLMMLDAAAAGVIYEELKVIRSAGIRQDPEDMIRNVLKKGIVSGMSEEGKLFVTDIGGALSSVRENIYIAGLSASNYPGSSRENYLLLDADLRLFGAEAEYLTSEGQIRGRRERLLRLAELGCGLGSSVTVSYAGMNVSELKRENASSLVYELYRRENAGKAVARALEKRIRKVDYFEPAISVTRKIGAAYNEGGVVLERSSGEEREAVPVRLDLSMEYSPSALEVFFGCPRRFLLGQVLGIPEPEDERPFDVMKAAERGTLAHSLMEALGNSRMSLEEFRALSDERFDWFVASHPPLVPQSAEAEKEEFLDMMETAYAMDPHREIVLEEEDIHSIHESGIRLHGYPDRVEKLEDGSYLVVDFKTGRKVVHQQDDINSCLQVVIYAYLMEKRGYRMAGGEYRYIRQGVTVPCRYDGEMKERLNEKLLDFRQHLEAADFPLAQADPDNPAAGPAACVFCKYGMICGKQQEGGLPDE